MKEEQEDKLRTELTRGDRYWARLEEAKKRLADVDARLDAIQQEVKDLHVLRVRLETEIEVLEPIYVEQEEQERGEYAQLANVGIQECCLRLLIEEGEPLTASGIRFKLRDRGVDLERYANPLAVIHTSLGRIPDRVRSFKRKELTGENGRVNWVRYYEAIRPSAGGKTATIAKP